MYELIISEKPQAAEKIAIALADSGVKKLRTNNVNYFSLKHKGNDIIVASAVGHLYILGEKGGESWEYPIFETEWKPIYVVNKEAVYTKDYIKTLTELGKKANSVTIASDFDIEGEVIGLNVLRFAIGRTDACRMKFSTLTKNELIKSYENKLPSIEWGQAKAGETRHNLDWFYGINLSRAFTESIKKGVNQFKVLSSGRVQAPSLHFLAQREKKIMDFKPEKYWEILLFANSLGIDFEAKYETDKIFEKETANKIVENTTGKNGFVKDITSKQFKQAVPIPFDLTSLQMEANTMFSYTPKITLEIAQKLYIEGVTSYPRTSSQKLPKELELDKIIDKLKKQKDYAILAEKVLKINPKLKPNEGPKTDPAHPAIYPTGEMPKNLNPQEQKLYDLICKRFFAVFGKDAIRETNTAIIDVNSYNFILKGTRTAQRNWHELYEPYLKFEEVEIPQLEKGKEIFNKEIKNTEKETSAPKRYTQASIIKELEKRNLGTKATRAAILESLYSRGYIVDKSIKVTELGLKMDEVISQELPIIVDEKLTREFEEEMQKIRDGKSTPEKILNTAKEKLMSVLSDVKKKEKELGIKLAGANYQAQKELDKFGKCPVCGVGDIVLRKSHKTNKRFAGCNNYPKCTNIYPLPQEGSIEKLDNPCPECSAPMIVLNRKGKKPWRFCINPNCPSKKNEKAEQES